MYDIHPAMVGRIELTHVMLPAIPIHVFEFSLSSICHWFDLITLNVENRTGGEECVSYTDKCSSDSAEARSEDDDPGKVALPFEMLDAWHICLYNHPLTYSTSPLYLLSILPKSRYSAIMACCFLNLGVANDWRKIKSHHKWPYHKNGHNQNAKKVALFLAVFALILLTPK